MVKIYIINGKIRGSNLSESIFEAGVRTSVDLSKNVLRETWS